MMRSVSMSWPRSGSARPVICRLMRDVPLRAHLLARRTSADVHDLAGDRRGGHHGRAHQQRAPGRAALPSLEIAIRRRRADLRGPAAGPGSSPRHIEQPAPRHSKPAARKISSSPSRFGGACARDCEPGTTSAFTRCATCWPLTMRAASRRSDSRPFVHEPMNATSIFVPAIGCRRLKPMNSSASATDGRSSARTSAASGMRSLDADRLPGVDAPRHGRLDRRARRSPPRRRSARRRRRPSTPTSATPASNAAPLRRERPPSHVLERRLVGIHVARRARPPRSTCCRSSSARPSTCGRTASPPYSYA